MSNHTGTILRIIGLFFGLISFWFTSIEFNVLNALSIFLILLFIRIFYPRYALTN